MYKWENPTLLEGKRPISIGTLKGGYKKLSFGKIEQKWAAFYSEKWEFRELVFQKLFWLKIQAITLHTCDLLPKLVSLFEEKHAAHFY